MRVGIIIAVIVILVILVALFLVTRGPDLSQFDHLRKPRITTMADQKMVIVVAEGDPNVVGKEAFNLLLKTYFKIKDAPKGPEQPAPRARWPISLDSPKSEWVGLYALPVPEQTTELPEHKAEPGLSVELTTWEYGDVAEILHIGPYHKEEPTIKALMDFVKEQGYEILGPHEEEYLKGPGMFSRGDPEKYYTIIRYRVSKVEAQ